MRNLRRLSLCRRISKSSALQIMLVAMVVCAHLRKSLMLGSKACSISYNMRAFRCLRRRKSLKRSNNLKTHVEKSLLMLLYEPRFRNQWFIWTKRPFKTWLNL